MKSATQLNNKSKPAKQLALKTGWLRLIPLLGSGALFSMLSLSAHAGSLISSTD